MQDCSGIIFYDDEPPNTTHVPSEYNLCFCTTKLRSKVNNYLPFPCPHALKWPEVGLADADTLTTNLINNNEVFRSNKIFWVGANTHYTRKILIGLSEQYQELFECTMMEWNRDNPNALSSRDYVSLWDHRHYKYLIDCPGTGYSGRLKWLLASGRPTFIVQRDVVEHWHEALEPWVHYIPVNKDLSDMMTAYKMIESDSSLYIKISQNAKKFAASRLALAAQVEDVSRNMRKFARSSGNF